MPWNTGEEQETSLWLFVVILVVKVGSHYIFLNGL